jgi:hypothetical protein
MKLHNIRFEPSVFIATLLLFGVSAPAVTANVIAERATGTSVAQPDAVVVPAAGPTYGFECFGPNGPYRCGLTTVTLATCRNHCSCNVHTGSMSCSGASPDCDGQRLYDLCRMHQYTNQPQCYCVAQVGPGA